jgi:hypothetical protein
MASAPTIQASCQATVEMKVQQLERIKERREGQTNRFPATKICDSLNICATHNKCADVKASGANRASSDGDPGHFPAKYGRIRLGFLRQVGTSIAFYFVSQRRLRFTGTSRPPNGRDTGKARSHLTEAARVVVVVPPKKARASQFRSTTVGKARFVFTGQQRES